MAGALAPELRDRIARVAARCLGEPVREVHALPAGLGLRRWFRVVAAGRRTAIARLDADEDPAGRPAGVPAEPELEPVRARCSSAPGCRCRGAWGAIRRSASTCSRIWAIRRSRPPSVRLPGRRASAGSRAPWT
jgi:hypothetical protein